ncbi:hypothetical protein CDD81_3310 [Ophiocordyceps australis]|uniref:Uncharacterized protein n=1 Tax=Ophiocordyceps australis TaxID=1399860 RepID=A0A2C5XAT5_9HYPO|nr:hypothetical protein CDD81_3310 [Ophiocordyceps australis]
MLHKTGTDTIESAQQLAGHAQVALCCNRQVRAKTDPPVAPAVQDLEPSDFNASLQASVKGPARRGAAVSAPTGPGTMVDTCKWVAHQAPLTMSQRRCARIRWAEAAARLLHLPLLPSWERIGWGQQAESRNLVSPQAEPALSQSLAVGIYYY